MEGDWGIVCGISASGSPTIFRVIRNLSGRIGYDWFEFCRGKEQQACTFRLAKIEACGSRVYKGCISGNKKRTVKKSKSL